MKKISAYLSNLLLVMMCFMFAACPSDSDSEPVSEPEKDLGIIGTWRYEFSSGYSYLYFGKTGFGWEHEYDEADGGWGEKEEFTYVYDATEKRIAIKWEDGYSEVVVVSALSEDRMALEDFGDSGLNFYDRVSDGEYKTGDEEDEPEPKPEPDKTKRLVKIEEREFEEDDEGFRTYTFKYDNQGNVIYALEYQDDYDATEFTDFSYTGNTISFQANYDSSWDERVTFDLLDDKICYAKREHYNNWDDKWKLDWEFNYEYNSTGLLKKIKALGIQRKGEMVGWSASYEKLTCLVENKGKFFLEFETENGMKGRRHFDELVSSVL